MKTKELAYWINERYEMKLRRDERDTPPWPLGWSTDPVMATTRWCNVHREDDKVTRWLRENWATKDSPVWWFVLGRMLNYIPTLESIVNFGVDDGHRSAEYLPSLDGLAEGLKARRESGEKIFTSAYTISTCGQRMDKIDYVLGVCAAVKEREEKRLLNVPPAMGIKPKLEFMFGSLTTIKGLGSFLAGQVLADLKNTPGHYLETALDRATWACPGPGSLRGLTAFYGRASTPRTFAQDLWDCKLATLPLVNPKVPAIDAQDWQNCMCEFSKYMKLSEGRGHARNRYPGNA